MPILKLAVILFLSFALHAQADGLKPVFTIESLLGKANSHSGPNCLNSVLIVKGYDNKLAYSSEPQLRFFLKKFCASHQEPALSGDIIVLMNHILPEHTVIAVDDGKIFEKEGPQGLFRGKSDISPYYQIKDINHSYLGELISKSGRELVYYTCQDFASVRKKMQACEKRIQQIGIDTIRNDFEKMSLTPSRDFSLSSEALKAMANVKKALINTPSNDPCLLYVIVMSYAVRQGLANFESGSFDSFAQHDVWENAQFGLDEPLQSAGRRLIKADASPVLKEILGPEILY